MPRILRILLILVLPLALLAWGASRYVHHTLGEWFEKDLRLRARLAVNGARQGLIAHWGIGQSGELGALLAEMARDEQILAAAACGADRSPLASTEGFPEPLGCEGLAARVQPPESASPQHWVAWNGVTSLPRGRVHVSAIPVFDRGEPLGFVVLIHDLSFVRRREAELRNSLLAAFGVLALAAWLLTLIAARLSWRRWVNEIRRFLKGERHRAEFQPILRDVRELIERIAQETEAQSEAGTWTPQRLKQTLTRHFHGEKVVILANREPYIHERAEDGSVALEHPTSGLVTALEPVMRACSGVWIAHGSGSADREVADGKGRLRVPPGEEAYHLRRVWLSPEEERGYYYGFANEGLWPLCHIAHARPIFRGEDWRHYQLVNQRFVDTLCEEIESEDPLVLVQDYHFALAPRLIRERLPRATVITFWHVPWPNFEHFGICPWRKDLLEGMLGSSILGFHTQFHCHNFIDAVDRYLEARIDREHSAVIQQGRSTLVRPYPISIEWPPRWLGAVPCPADCRAWVFADLKLPPDSLLGIGVDRLDYTKGIEERLACVERLLERFPSLRGRFTFVQLAAPSRTAIERYRQLNENVEQLAARINERFGGENYRPIVLLRSHHEPPAVFRFYRAADFCYVSSLHDGMNLVAKEFVSARDDECGVLVLSQFTGAARELTEALIVNPYDLDEASSALARALHMSGEEQRERMRSMRAFVAEFNVYRWAGRMLVDAARLRRRERLSGRAVQRLVRSVGVGS